MKIKTADGNTFDVPEENVKAFLAKYETAKKFDAANKELQDIDKQLNPGGKYGLARNTLQGLIPGAARAEGALRSIPSGFQDYSKYRDWARKSASEYAYAYPDKALAATLAGAFIPSAAMTIASFGLGSGAGAANMARAATNVAAAVNTAKKARLAERALRATGGNAALGGLYGFMDEKSEDVLDRLGTSLGSGIIGGAVGGVTPLALSGLGRVGNTIKRIKKGMPESSLSSPKVEDFILTSGALANTSEGSAVADILRKASVAGATDIYDPIYNMDKTLTASKNLWDPGMLTDITAPEATAARDILRAGHTPQMEEAAQRYTNFVESVKDTPGQGLVASEFLKRNPVAKKILSVEPSLDGLPVGSFEWFKNAEAALRNSLPAKVDTDRLVGRKASIMRSIDDMSKTREMIHPGTTQANLDYAVGKAWETEGTKTVGDRLKFMNNMPTETSPAFSSREVLGLGYKPYLRGRAREYIEKGQLYQRPSATNQILMQIFDDALINSLRLH